MTRVRDKESFVGYFIRLEMVATGSTEKSICTNRVRIS